MQMSQFIQKSGFKVLAMARLSQCEYSVVLYLMNCAVSGLEQIITTPAELAGLIGADEEAINEAIVGLSDKHLIRVRYGENHGHTQQHPPLRLAFQFDITKWHLGYDKHATSSDAIVYPFLRSRRGHLEILPTDETREALAPNDYEQTWQRLLDAFVGERQLDAEAMEENLASAKILVETHPIDQVILLLRHFHNRIPSLSLLASNWDHYLENYEQETQKVDLSDARKKHQELDLQLKQRSKTWLEQADKLQLSSAEINILQLLIRHRHPRRQLFWAYQARSRYLNLDKFFEENAPLMLAITSLGTILKKPTSLPENNGD